MESFTLKNGGKMNTYYLKKFRKKAFRHYGVFWDGSYCKDIWRVRTRNIIRPYEYIGRSHHSKEDALEELKRLRNEYVLDRAREIRHNRIYKKKYREYNKQLAKL